MLSQEAGVAERVKELESLVEELKTENENLKQGATEAETNEREEMSNKMKELEKSIEVLKGENEQLKQTNESTAAELNDLKEKEA